MKDRGIYLLTVFDSIQRIGDYTAGMSMPNFLEDRKTQDAVIRNIEIIGQAIKDFGVEDLVRDWPDIPGQPIVGMRNVVAHEYLGIDMEITWQVVAVHPPVLMEALKDVARQLEVEIPDAGGELPDRA